MLMRTMEEQAMEKRVDQKAGFKELRAEMKSLNDALRAEMKASNEELRAAIESLQRNMLFGFFSLAGIILTYAGFQLS
jgi:ABC-type Fe3+-hydroxamate transport system substrate-binding protein